MTLVTVIGIDPGLVNTGVVVLRANTRQHHLNVEHFVIDGKVNHAKQVAELLDSLGYSTKHVFIEGFRERGNQYAQDKAMRDLMVDFRSVLPKATVLDNMGVKKIVPTDILGIFGMDNFPATHHRDLESAARILIYGMLKDDKLNEVVYSIVSGYVHLRPWSVMSV